MRRDTTIRVALALLVLLGIAGWLVLSEDSPINRASAINATCEWARLIPLPKSAKDVVVETTGTMFTRQFRITFTAPVDDIQRWLKDSPGTKDVTPDRQDDGSMLFLITPGGGAQFAEVILSKDKRTVRIRAYWS